MRRNRRGYLGVLPTVALGILGTVSQALPAALPNGQPDRPAVSSSSAKSMPAEKPAKAPPFADIENLPHASLKPPQSMMAMNGGMSSSAAAASFTNPHPNQKGRPAWGPTTSGPFFTGTAEVEPMGSSYWEPYLLDFTKSGSKSMDFNQKMAIGMGNNLEFDAQVPLLLNIADPPATPAQSSVDQFGPGDAHLDFKYQLTRDQDTYKLLAWPALTLTTDFFIPSGNASGLRPNRYGVDQFGNGTFQEGLSLLIRKRARPFSFYGQIGDLVANPTSESQGYGYDNGIGTLQSGKHVRVVDGNLLYYNAAIEYVLNSRHGIGFLTEVNGESQSLHNLFYGRATAPSYSYLSAAPEVEYTWPASKRFAITWGAGVDLPMERGDYPRIVTPMLTVTFCFNGPNGGRNSE